MNRSTSTGRIPYRGKPSRLECRALFSHPYSCNGFGRHHQDESITVTCFDTGRSSYSSLVSVAGHECQKFTEIIVFHVSVRHGVRSRGSRERAGGDSAGGDSSSNRPLVACTRSTQWGRSLTARVPWNGTGLVVPPPRIRRLRETPCGRSIDPISSVGRHPRHGGVWDSVSERRESRTEPPSSTPFGPHSAVSRSNP